MRRLPALCLAVAVLLSISFAVLALAQNAGGQNGGGGDGPPPQNGGGGGQGGGGGAGGGGPPPPGFHLIPRFAEEKLNLTDDQQQQIQQLEQETKTKLAKILTPAQMQILETARPPRRGGGPNGGGQNGGGPNGGGQGRNQGGPGGGPGGGSGGGGQGGGDQGPPN